jgi:ectoine hydroxylase-related dioxygenase (phytanoyl-CoA dioxygenase family)
MNLKQFKPAYWLYNLLHFKDLRHNREAYRKYNIHKPLIASISSKDFPDKESKAWLDVGNSALLATQKESFGNFPADVREQILEWSTQGYLILKSFFDSTACDAINKEIENLIHRRKIIFTGNHKLMFANRKSAYIKAITHDPKIVNLLGFLLGKEVIPFQTINFISGSEQRAHSDSVHMTTYPLGFLIAIWIALEDVNHDNGPLFYYPGSHKMPYLLNNDFNAGETLLTLGKKDYVDYEDMVEELVKKNGYQAREFHANKGDVFIWHANLVHGGAPIINKESTRNSMVIHYYAKDVIKYHEITERPSLLEH